MYIYTSKPQMSAPSCTKLKSISTYISMHKCIYFTVFPVIKV